MIYGRKDTELLAGFGPDNKRWACTYQNGDVSLRRWFLGRDGIMIPTQVGARLGPVDDLPKFIAVLHDAAVRAVRMGALDAAEFDRAGLTVPEELLADEGNENE